MSRDVHQLAMAARNGDLAALRELHFPQRKELESFEDLKARFTFALRGGPELVKLLDRDKPLRRPTPPRPGGIDFHRIHCLALDRLHDFLAVMLPDGQEAGSWGGRWCWLGSHPMRPEPVHVCLMLGVWTEPNTGKAGLDLVSLYSHMFGVSHGRGAHLLAQWLGAEVRAYAA